MPLWQLRSLYGVTAAVIISGAAWLLLHYFGRTEGDFGPAPNPFEHPVIAAHGAAAMAFLILLGSLLPVHITLGWAQRRNHRSGIVMLCVIGLLTVSGYGLYYASGDAFREAVSLMHWTPGLVLGAVLVWHIRSGRSRRGR